MAAGHPLPRPDADSRPYWAAAAAGELQIQYCTACGQPRFYPRLLCPHCHSAEHRWAAASGHGTVYSFTVIRRAPLPAFADDVPYIVALIDLDEGVRMMSTVRAEPSQLTIGTRVQVQFRTGTDQIAVPVFVPAVEAS